MAAGIMASKLRPGIRLHPQRTCLDLQAFIHFQQTHRGSARGRFTSDLFEILGALEVLIPLLLSRNLA